MATFNGTDGNDLLPPVGGNNSGDDNFNPGKGADTIDGGAGSDTLSINNSSDPVTAPTTISYTTVTNGTITGGSNNGTTFQNIERVRFTTGSGNDNINVLAATDGRNDSANISAGAGNDTIVGALNGAINTYNGGDGDDTITSNSRASGLGDALNGDAGNDTLNGGAGDDRLNPGTGADIINGGTGDNSLNINNSTDTANTTINYTTLTNGAITGGFNNGTTFNNIKRVNFTTGSGNDNIDVSAATNGGNASVNISAGAGNDTIVGGLNGSINTYNGGGGDDTITSNSRASGFGDALNGDAGNDTLNGGAGDDRLNPGTGADVINGGTGKNQLTINNSSDTVDTTINYTTLTNGTITGGFNNGTTFQNIKSVRFTTGSGNDNIDVSAATNGGNASVQISAGAGNDTIVGALNGSINTYDGGGGNDTITSNSSASGGGDALNGDAGDDTLISGAGSDRMSGGDGNDSYIIKADNNNNTININENATGGIDTLSFQTSTTAININLSQTAPQTIAPNVRLTSSPTTGGNSINFIENVIGGSGNDTITGNILDNRLDGGAGGDNMSGGAGNDTYVVDNAGNFANPGDIVTEAVGAGTDTVESSITYALLPNVENLTLTGTADIGGIGNDLNNVIIGNAGNNILNGQIGADTMSGGAGNDIYLIDNAGDIVTEAVGAGIDEVQSSLANYTLTDNVENLTLFGPGGLSGTGNALDNIIIGALGNNTLSGGDGNDSLNGGGDGDDTLNGDAGNDILDGGVGADALNGGTGDDTYIVDEIGDRVTEAANEGTDLVQSSISYTLTANVENLTITGAANMISGFGNELDNIITGNSGVNILNGAAGNDTLNGLAGNDMLNPGTGADKIDGGAGDDTLTINNSTDTADTTISYTTTSNGTIAGGFNNGTTFQNIEVVNFTTGSGKDNINISATVGFGGINVNSGAGDDTIVGSLTGAYGTYNGGAGNDTITGGTGGNNVLNGGDGDDTITSNSSGSFGDILSGGAGNDTLIGGTAPAGDSLSGGAGDDTYVINANVSQGTKRITETLAGGTDTLSFQSSTIATNVDLSQNATQTVAPNVTVASSGSAASGFTGLNYVENVIGGTGNDIITGNTLDNILNGGLGSDTISGGLGNDTYIVDNAGDIVTEAPDAGTDNVQSATSYTLTDNVENLTLTGTSDLNGTGNGLANTITGNAGNNILDGGVGADTMNGGAGNDTYIVDNAADVVQANSTGINTVQSSIDYTLGANVQNLTLTGITDINGTGNGLANTITGTAGNNILDGGVGIDTMIGGLGNDTYIVDNSGDIVTEAADAGTDNVQASTTYILADNVENLTLTGAGDSNGTGNTFANTITGNAGNNILDGGLGADTMNGGAGNDTYIVDNTADVVQANSTGINTVQSSIDYTLGANVQNLTLTGVGDINGTGNGLANTITGNAGNNILDGGLGIDTMIGGLGNDTYIIDNSGDIVTEAAGAGTDNVQSSVNYILADNVENLTLTGAGDSNGTGNTFANTITGNAGNNILDGGVGADTMIGGLGNDTYIIDNSGDIVTEAADAGTDNVQSSITYTLTDNIENLTLTGAGDLNGTGNGLANTITGTAGNNILDGELGIDTMIGGLGNDTYIIDNSGDIITEAADAGTDNVQSSITYTLADNVENLTLTGAGDLNGTGNGLANTITGNAGNNILDGGAGIDTMIGGLGNDTYIIDNSGDIITEAPGAGIDNVQASVNYTLTDNVENLTLTGTTDLNGTGNGLANTITGNAGNNIFTGGGGADNLFGGSGNDTYIVSRSLGGGTIINDLSGTNDTLSLLGETSLTANQISRNSTTLLIDLNQNGVFDLATDLSISNFFANTTGSAAGNGFIENVDSLSGSVVLNLYTSTRNDFNTDKKSDILWLNDYGSIALWQMDGATVTNGALTSVPSIDSSWKTAGTVDFNGDLKTDILWRNDNGAVAIWTMDGSTVVSSNLTSTPTLDNSWKTAGTNDFNGDGKADILWRNDNGAVAVWTMDGSTVVSSTLASTPTLDNSWKTAATGDFSGDGKADILWRNDDGSIALWQMDGSTVLNSSLTSTPTLDSSWKINGTGDFNGDGKADVLWRNTSNDAVAVWQMNGVTVVDSSLTSTPTLDSSWAFNGIGDFNGDSKSDILWRKDSGATAIWEMSGANIVSSTLTSIPADSSSWRVAGVLGNVPTV